MDSFIVLGLAATLLPLSEEENKTVYTTQWPDALTRTAQQSFYSWASHTELKQ